MDQYSFLRLVEGMSRQEFDTMGETWYKRTHALREAWQFGISPRRAKRAYLLWEQMLQRMMFVAQVTSYVNTRARLGNYTAGGEMQSTRRGQQRTQ